MKIDKLLKALNLDLSNPEVVKGALGALDAILASRQAGGGSGGSGGGGGDMEVELDPELIMPSSKSSADVDDDFEIEDEDDILSKIKQNKSEEEDSSESSDKSGQGDSSSSSSSTDSSDEMDDIDFDDDEDGEESSDETSDSGDTTSDSSVEDSDDSSETDEIEVDDLDDSEGDDTDEENPFDLDFDGEADADSEETEDEDGDSTGQGKGDGDETEGEDELGLGDADEDEDDESEDGEEDEDAELNDDDLIDDDVDFTDTEPDPDSKANRRRLTRAHILQTAKDALVKAKANNVAESKIKELEASIAALEALTEAAGTSIDDLSDEEFARLTNRVLDAIDACGESGITYKTADQKATQVKEIKDDLESDTTRDELSREDVEKIRAEHQTQVARAKENDRYAQKAPGSFKGFEAFLTSLYKAIALQVHTIETNNDTWSALNRRYSGTGVLRQGSRKEELPEAKIPIIDFYFDCSGSWSDKHLAFGEKAVESLVDLERKGKIKLNIYYFSDDVYTDISAARAGGSTEGWNSIVSNVVATKATNVVVMTDSDMENWWVGPKALQYTVQGYVWYLWRDGVNAPRLPRDLRGRGGTQQFSFTTE